MNTHLIFALLAVLCFLLSAVGADQGKGIPVGLIFLTLMLAF
jgi:hypothetical protein